MTNRIIKQNQSPISERVEDLIKLSELFSQFMDIKRATWRDGRPETDAEHTLHAMFLAVAYTAKFHPEFDPAEVALLVMIHDLDELYVGDTNSLVADDKTIRQKESAERTTRDRLRHELTGEPFIMKLLERYWAQEEPITQYVRAIEKLDPSFSHLRDDGQALSAMGITDKLQYEQVNDRAIERMSGYGECVAPDVVEIRRHLGRLVGIKVVGAV